MQHVPHSQRWVESASEYGYPATGGAFPDLVCRVLYGQAREEPGLLRAMTEELSELADELMERRELRRQQGGPAAPLDAPERAFVMVCRDLRAAMEACIGLHAARAMRSPPTRAPGLYVWSLVNTLVRRFEHGDGDAYFRALVAATVDSAPTPWAAMTETLAAVSARMNSATGWPDPKDAHHLVLHFQHLEPVWTRHAAALQHNGLRPRGNGQRGLARRAAGACRLARHTFIRLSSPHGWLRLHVEYLLELLDGVDRLAREGRPFEEFADVAIHDLGYVMGSLAGGPSTWPASAPYPYAESHSGGPAERKRIERGRARCLGRWSVHEPDPFWDEYDVWGALEEIGNLQAAPGVGTRG